ncbi:hypothetical protein OK016_12880 [Vibrio chagasii]|nr:hypothetical protein [Vibrio chagasii]
MGHKAMSPSKHLDEFAAGKAVTQTFSQVPRGSLARARKFWQVGCLIPTAGGT